MRFSPADQHSQAAAHSASSVLEWFLSMPLCTRQELFPLSRCIKKQGGEQTYLQISIHSNFMYVQKYTDTLTPTQGERERESLDTEQWHASAQDVYVTSRVCEQSFGVALETKCNIEKSPLRAEKSQSIRESQASSPTRAAAARLSAMIHGKDQVYANAMLVDQVSHSHYVICEWKFF